MPTGEITELLVRCPTDPEAAERLFPIVYGELRRLAASRLRKERADHSFETSDLVHEAYLRLIGAEAMGWRERGHFFAVAATAMRRILIDHARRKRAARRIPPGLMVPLDDSPEIAAPPHPDLLDLDQALDKLAALDQRQARVVELRYFGGLSLPEIAGALGLSESSVSRAWKGARLWLRREIRTSAASG